jgi:hypothetical protein
MIALTELPAHVAWRWRDGTATVTTREVIARYVARYGEPEVRLDAATPAEIAEYERASEEAARG